jgi:hypothetical protein
MCPLCITTVALLAGSAGSSAGLTAVLARRLRTRQRDKRAQSNIHTSGAEHGPSKSGLTK